MSEHYQILPKKRLKNLRKIKRFKNLINKSEKSSQKSSKILIIQILSSRVLQKRFDKVKNSLKNCQLKIQKVF